MNNTMIVQAWKSPEYRASLSNEQRTALPENPSGRPLTELRTRTWMPSLGARS